MAKKKKTAVERAAELLRENPGLKHYQAMQQARRELSEMVRGTTPGTPREEK